MNSRLQSIVFWFLWAAVVIGTICLIAHEARAAAPTKGSGAASLLKGIKKSAPPTVPLAAPPPAPRTLFFAATAADASGQRSEYSSEVSTTNRSPITLAWDYPTNGMSFTVYRGTNSGHYTFTYPAGTNHILSVPPPAPTVVVVTVSGSTNFSITNPVGVCWFTGRNLTITRSYQ